MVMIVVMAYSAMVMQHITRHDVSNDGGSGDDTDASDTMVTMVMAEWG